MFIGSLFYLNSHKNFSYKIYLLVLFIFFKYESSFCKWKVWDKELDWWQKSIVYQIYPRSFQDSDGDGVGDLKGITSRLYYFNETGIDTIWLSPIFKSPMADLGYDISDFKDIDPSFGTLEDFKNLVKEVKARGMYLLTDFVPNHTSDQHEWFQKSVESNGPYTDYYVWKDGRKLENGSTTYPNNWLSVFGGSGWTYNEKRGQYYYHQFSPKQPDLNLTNPLVREELKETLKFWMDLGVDGFRMDAVKHLMEDPDFHDESCWPKYEGTCDDAYDKMFHNYTTDWPTTYYLIYEWRQLLDEYRENSSQKHTRIMLTEAYSSIDYLMRYYGNESNPGAQSPFNFMLVRVDENEDSLGYLNILNHWYDNMPEGHWANWVTGNHDNHRVATKMGNELVDAFFMMSMLLPGTAVTYQGDELGQPDTLVRPDQVRDPNNNGGGAVDVRDPERGPFLWDDTENAGFTSSKFPWEPIHPAYWKINLEAQKIAARSHYKIYKQISDLRKTATIQRGDLLAKNLSTWVFGFARQLPGNETYVIVINFGSEREVVCLSEYIANIPDKMNVAVSSINSGYEDGEIIDSKILIHSQQKPLVLRPKASVVLTSKTVQPTSDPPRNGAESPWNFSHRTIFKKISMLIFIIVIIIINM